MGRAAGLSDEDVADISCYERSDTYDELDTLVLRFATVMTQTPADVSADLRRALLERLGRGALAELAATIAWENHRARLNRALGVQPAGFSDGSVCALPVHQPGPRNDAVEEGGVR